MFKWALVFAFITVAAAVPGVGGLANNGTQALFMPALVGFMACLFDDMRAIDTPAQHANHRREPQ